VYLLPQFIEKLLLLAYKLEILDIPRGRHAHKAPTALLGGLAVFMAFALTIWRNSSFNIQLKGIVIGGIIILIVGLWDDIKELPARLKLLVQVGAVAILIYHGVVISFLPDTLWGNIGEWALTAFWVVGITNAINFLDGMDGLASGLTAITAMFFGLVALQNGQDSMVYLALPLVGACLGFLPYNFRMKRNALIFLGDAGSTFLGFTLASLAVMGDWAGNYTVRLIVPLLILGVPIFDMSFTTFMRVKNGQVRSFKEWVDFTGRDHIHHRLEGLHIGRVGAVAVIYVVTFWLGLSALVLKNATGLNAILQVGQSVIVFLLMGFFMVFVQREYHKIEQESHHEAE
jgi:UDP-GlcNAc:undecaprenyl-phosphate GlcNAc-1-phosphate transferase